MKLTRKLGLAWDLMKWKFPLTEHGFNQGGGLWGKKLKKNPRGASSLGADNKSYNIRLLTKKHPEDR